jgi:hypothetical protein
MELLCLVSAVGAEIISTSLIYLCLSLSLSLQILMHLLLFVALNDYLL